MDEAALLAEIAANPDDDAPRLVYADLLAERGDPRGELIQLQLEQTRTGNTLTLQNRIGDLERAHESRWLAEAGVVGALSNFRRGFPASLIGSAANVLASRQALRTQPITSLSILSRFDGLDELMRLPELARIRELHVSGILGDYGRHAPLSPAQLGAIAQAPFANLRELWIGDDALDAAGAAALAGAPWLPGVERLILAKGVDATSFAPIAARLRDVRWLALGGGCHVGPDGAQALARAALHQLDHVWLERNGVHGEGAIALAGSPILATVTHLDLGRNFIEDEGAIALARSPHLANVHVLRLGGNAISAAGAAALAGSPHLASVVELDLRDNLLGHEGLAALVASTGLPALRRLGVTNNQLKTGKYETFEAGSEAAGDYYAGSYDVELDAAEIRARFAHRPGLVVE